jgi:predicted aspartyl protease
VSISDVKEHRLEGVASTKLSRFEASTLDTGSASSIEIHKSEHLIVKAKVNQMSVMLVIDTLAGATVIDEASGIGLNLSPERQNVRSAVVRVGGQTNPSKVSKGNILPVGIADYESVDILVVDISNAVHALKASRLAISGILDADFLIKQRAVIDYDKTK